MKKRFFSVVVVIILVIIVNITINYCHNEPSIGSVTLVNVTRSWEEILSNRLKNIQVLLETIETDSALIMRKFVEGEMVAVVVVDDHRSTFYFTGDTVSVYDRHLGKTSLVLRFLLSEKRILESQGRWEVDAVTISVLSVLREATRSYMLFKYPESIKALGFLFITNKHIYDKMRT